MRHAALWLLLAAALVSISAGEAPEPFSVVDASIAEVHTALRAGRLTCRALVESYLARISAYDKNGPALNAIVQTNPRAMGEAALLDARFAAAGLVGPMHCVPTIVKDNFARWYEAGTVASVVAEARNAAAPRNLPIYFQEPTAWGPRAGDDPTSGRFAAAVEAARLAGAAAWTFHQRVGFNLQRESFQDRIARDPAMKRELERIGERP